MTVEVVQGGGGEGEGEGEGEPLTIITSNVYPPFIDEGTIVILTAPGATGHQWKMNGTNIDGATNKTLVFTPVTEGDAGGYTVLYENGAKAIVETPVFKLEVGTEGSVPVTGLLGLAALAAACGLGGASVVRRRNNNK